MVGHGTRVTGGWVKINRGERILMRWHYKRGRPLFRAWAGTMRAYQMDYFQFSRALKGTMKNETFPFSPLPFRENDVFQSLIARMCAPSNRWYLNWTRSPGGGWIRRCFLSKNLSRFIFRRITSEEGRNLQRLHKYPWICWVEEYTRERYILNINMFLISWVTLLRNFSNLHLIVFDLLL